MVINGRNDNNEHYHLVMTEAWLSIESTKSMDLMPFVTQLGLVRLVNSECECGKRVPYPRQLFFGICGSLASQSCRFPGRIFFSRACLVYFGPRNLDTSVQRRTHVGHVQITQKRQKSVADLMNRSTSQHFAEVSCGPTKTVNWPRPWDIPSGYLT